MKQARQDSQAKWAHRAWRLQIVQERNQAMKFRLVFLATIQVWLKKTLQYCEKIVYNLAEISMDEISVL